MNVNNHRKASAVRRTVEIEHIVFGTAYPYSSETVSKLTDSHLDGCPALGSEKKEQISKGAGSCFPVSAELLLWPAVMTAIVSKKPVQIH